MKIILYSIAFAAMLLSATNALAAGSVSKSAVQATTAATATSASSKIDAMLDSYESAINSASAVADKAKKGDKAAQSSRLLEKQDQESAGFPPEVFQATLLRNSLIAIWLLPRKQLNCCSRSNTHKVIACNHEKAGRVYLPAFFLLFPFITSCLCSSSQ